MVLYVGGDLGRKRLDWQALWPDGSECAAGASPPDADGLAGLARRLGGLSSEVVVVIESMTGARFVHDQLEAHGLEVRIADARKAKVAAGLLGQVGAKTDRLDAYVLAELGRRELVPEIWLPDPATRGARERSRFRLHLVRHRTMLKNRIHQTLIQHGVAPADSDLFGARGRRRLAALSFGYSGLCPRVEQSGESDRRGPLRNNGPKWLRWALVEAAQHAARHPLYRDLYQSTKRRLGKQRGPRVAQVTIARKLAKAIWHMLTRNQPFAPAGASRCPASQKALSELRYRSRHQPPSHPRRMR